MAAERVTRRQTDIDYETILLQIEDAARTMGIDLRYENLADDDVNIGSGLCHIHSKPSLIIDKRLDPKRKLFIIAKELSKIDTGSIYLQPIIREFIESVRK